MNKDEDPPNDQMDDTDDLEEIQDNEVDIVPGTPIIDVLQHNTFPIVGIGASAGGLEALELFLKNVPSDNGMAFVVIQHLDPTHKGIMAELLQRSTPMPVVQVKDRMKVEIEHVYIIPPNKDMSILHGVLHLFAPAAPRGLRLPIDYFLRSLADDQQERSVGVILSGMGSDGTLGLRAIKEKAGVTFVQNPSNAKFDGMPRSVMDAGLADVAADVEELPNRILAYLRHAPLLARSDVSLESKNQSALEKIFIILRAQTGHDFSLYKRSTLYRRIERRMGLHQIDRIVNYVRFLQENPQESELLFKELLIGVTSFFRDPAAWEQMKGEVIPELLATCPPGTQLRAWTPGCSTGEEAYSLAIIFREALEQVKMMGNLTLQIFATDLDRDAIDKARQGAFPANIAADVSPERLRRFFVQEENGFRVGKEIREMVIFAPQNLVMDPPFTKLDILICRNLLIYLAPELQKKLLPLFHYSLNPGGALFLGSAETIGTFTSLFTPLDGKLRLYRRANILLQDEVVDFPATFFAPSPTERIAAAIQPKTAGTVPNLQTMADQLLLQSFTPPAVLVNERGDILYINGRTGKYLEPPAGKVNWNIFAMAREGLRYELSSAFQKAQREKIPITTKNVTIGTNGGTQVVDLTIKPLIKPEAMQNLYFIIFQDVAPLLPVILPGKKRAGAASDIRTAQYEQEIQRTHEELQTMREEMQTSQEELKSTNEELQSTNEELQSTNEELTTSKEEMQSLNEELQTVNHELQARVDELSRSNNDMKNLLNSTDIATLFLDENLNVRRFTSQISQIIKLIPSDVGRSIMDITSELFYSNLVADVNEVLRSLVFKEMAVASHDGHWYIMRILPYRTLDNRIDGVVITFTDITSSKKLEGVLRENELEMKSLVKYMTNAFGVFDAIFENGRFIDGRFVYINDTYEHIMGLKDKDMHAKLLSEVLPGAEGDWLNICGQVTVSGVPNSFLLVHAVTGKSYTCNVYRPGESQERFCIILEETKGQ